MPRPCPWARPMLQCPHQRSVFPTWCTGFPIQAVTLHSGPCPQLSSPLVHPTPFESSVNSPVPLLGPEGIVSCLLPSTGLPPPSGLPQIIETMAAGQVSGSSSWAMTSSKQNTAPLITIQVHSMATGPAGSAQLKCPSFPTSALSASQIYSVPSGHRALAHAIPVPVVTFGIWSPPPHYAESLFLALSTGGILVASLTHARLYWQMVQSLTEGRALSNRLTGI